MKRTQEDFFSDCWKRYCTWRPEVIPDVPRETSKYVEFQDNQQEVKEEARLEKIEPKKDFYSGENGIIRLKENIISIVDAKPRIINQYALAALKKQGTYFAQTKTALLGPFSTTPTPKDLPEGELVMIYECCTKFSETSTSCFRPIGLYQN